MKCNPLRWRNANARLQVLQALAPGLEEEQLGFPSSDDMNARTAEQADYTRLADLQDFVDVPDQGAYLGADVAQRRNCDKAPAAGNWGDELLELCRSTELLIVNGRTPGDPAGKYTYTSPQGQSV